jgi:hypothetical protein
VDTATDRVSVQMVPTRDRLRRASIFFLTTAWLCLLALIALNALHLAGSIQRRGWLSLGTWGYVYTGLCLCFACSRLPCCIPPCQQRVVI